MASRGSFQACRLCVGWPGLCLSGSFPSYHRGLVSPLFLRHKVNVLSTQRYELPSKCDVFVCVCCLALVEFTEADEALADQALLGDVFLFMREGMLGCDGFGQEEFYIRRLHSLITDFLALMPMKVRDVRGVHCHNLS